MILHAEDLPDHMQSQLQLVPGARKAKRSKRKEAADEFAFQLRAHGFTGWVREHTFAKEHNGRLWRFDFSHPLLKIAVEIDGLRVERIGNRTVCTGRHSTVDGYREDCLKLATAWVLGWYVPRFVQDQVMNGVAIGFVEQWYAARGLNRNGGAA
jgi:hypothetical protein